MVLKRYPVTAVHSVSVDGTAADVTLYGADENGILRRLDGRALPCGMISVEYSAGYVLPGDAGTRTLPHDIERVCIALAVRAYLGIGRDPSVRSETVDGIGGRTYFDNGGLGGLQDIAIQLAAYRQPLAL